MRNSSDPSCQVRDLYFYHCLAGTRDPIKHVMLNECLIVYGRKHLKENGKLHQPGSFCVGLRMIFAEFHLKGILYSQNYILTPPVNLAV